jgi:hypothetical protein
MLWGGLVKKMHEKDDSINVTPLMPLKKGHHPLV